MEDTTMKSNMVFFWGDAEQSVNMAMEELAEKRIVERIWQKDYTVWKEHPQEISNRLDWLSITEEMKPQLKDLKEFVRSLCQEGFQQAILLGMGGSSLAPELFSRVFPPQEAALQLWVLDTTDPEVISRYTDYARQKKTIYIVSTKSGNTLETLMLFRHFFALVSEESNQNPGQHFVAITDPGSPLVKLAEEHHFRRVFLNNPNIGGRYSAFSFFGLVPAALAGVNLERLLTSVEEGRQGCSPELPVRENYGALLGTMMGVLARKGRDKLTLFFSPLLLKSLGDWIEQLVAESTGKEGKGILPVIEGSPQDWNAYGTDRCFVWIGLERDHTMEVFAQQTRQKNYPFLSVTLPDVYALGEQMFLWEFATALAGYFLHINPFDQPNVEETKVLTKKRIESLKILPDEEALPVSETIHMLPVSKVSTPREALQDFFSFLPPDGYVALQAFLPYDKTIETEMKEIALLLGRKLHRAVTVGFGPRFLHSTGQLHKGDAGKGVFMQFLSESTLSLPIPGERLDFGSLKKAQALGDREALRNRGRRVLTFIIADGLPENLTRIREFLVGNLSPLK